MNIEEEEGPADEVYLAASKSQPSTLKKKRHSPLTVSTSLESGELVLEAWPPWFIVVRFVSIVNCAEPVFFLLI